jgi:hypothetical protein
MIETFLILLTGHLLGDFVFQPDALIQRKTKLSGMLWHIAIVGALTTLVLAPVTIWAATPIAVVLITHFAMDYIKTKWLGDRLWAFALDQAVHLTVIAALAAAWPEIAAQSFWGARTAEIQSYVYAGLALICGLTVGVAVGGVVIKKIVDPLSPMNQIVPAATGGPVLATGAQTATNAPIVGMRNAGRYIGWLERALAITFILFKQPEGVGLLLAAKSILRFRDVQDQNDRHQAEYIIIGTFLSFGWAILVALITRAAITHWLPV